MLLTSILEEVVLGHALIHTECICRHNCFGFKNNQTFKAAAWTFRTPEQGENFRTFK